MSPEGRCRHDLVRDQCGHCHRPSRARRLRRRDDTPAGRRGGGLVVPHHRLTCPCVDCALAIRLAATRRDTGRKVVLR